MFRFLKRSSNAPDGHEEITRSALLRILELNKEMARAAKPEALPDRVLDAAIELAGAERGFLIVRAGTASALAARVEGGAVEGRAVEGLEAGPGWEVVAARNLDREHLKKALRKLSRSITTGVLDSGVAFRSDDALNDETLNPKQSVADLKLRSVLCVPMRVGEEVRGCLYVDNRFAQGRFDEHSQELLEAFADQAALSLERVRLLEENTRMLRSVELRNEELKGALAERSKALESLSEGFVPSGLELRHRYPAIVGRGRAITAMLTVVDRITEGDFPVLLYGESGTGKELVARALHENGPRREKPFTGVNCGAIAEGLLESELFGAVKGAYTGAVRDRAGLIESSAGGVLFLDEIGEMSLALQAKLLRVLQERRLRRVGGNEEISVDVRVISATHRDLAREVSAGRFREDLYYRLKVVQVEVPPLRERREDISVLVETFLERLHAEHKASGRARPQLARECLERLLAHDWPGNVRELQNEITRMHALGGDLLGPELVAHLSKAPRVAGQGGVRGLVGRKLEDVEAELIRATLELTDGRRGEAAKILGIPRRTFYNRLKSLGLEA
ncbi:MAG: sigma-54-dependent Fis family transcriptional regulator [Planctomycetes bacterium]|nr:sigma-54-dependent Fis family transcriptional regulator [Planctomycetota bacterium]